MNKVKAALVVLGGMLIAVAWRIQVMRHTQIEHRERVLSLMVHGAVSVPSMCTTQSDLGILLVDLEANIRCTATWKNPEQPPSLENLEMVTVVCYDDHVNSQAGSNPRGIAIWENGDTYFWGWCP